MKINGNVKSVLAIVREALLEKENSWVRQLIDLLEHKQRICLSREKDALLTVAIDLEELTLKGYFDTFKPSDLFFLFNLFYKICL